MKIFIAILLSLATFTGYCQEVRSFKVSDGETLYYTRHGSGPKVVFLYGGPGYAVSAMNFWADSLSDQFECILYDQRGTGLSGKVKLDESTINLKRAVADLNDLRVNLKEEKLTLCGISWGAMLAQSYAAFYPENTGKIVLVSTLGPDLSSFAAFNDNMNMRRFPAERDSLRCWMDQPDSELSSMKRSFFQFIPEFYDHSIGNEMLKVFFASTTFHDRMSSLIWQDLYSSYDLKPKLGKYDGEAVIIRPRQDPAPAEAVFQIKELLPQASIIYIEKCGHFPDYERPAEFFKILRSVLKQGKHKTQLDARSQNKKIIELYVNEIWNNRNIELADSIIGNNFIDPAANSSVKGPESLKRVIKSYLEKYPDIKISIDEMVYDEHKIAWKWTAE